MLYKNGIDKLGRGKIGEFPKNGSKKLADFLEKWLVKIWRGLLFDYAPKARRIFFWDFLVKKIGRLFQNGREILGGISELQFFPRHFCVAPIPPGMQKPSLQGTHF